MKGKKLKLHHLTKTFLILKIYEDKLNIFY